MYSFHVELIKIYLGEYFIDAAEFHSDIFYTPNRLHLIVLNYHL